jgi:hypothetical protein
VSGPQHRSFAEAIAVTPLGAGRYRGSITPEWFGPPGPNGGFIAALMLRAIRDEIADEDRLPRSLTLHYLHPPVEGDAEIEVTVERSGGSASTCLARIIQSGRTVTLGLCVLSYDYESGLTLGAQGTLCSPAGGAGGTHASLPASARHPARLRRPTVHGRR